MTKKLSSKQKKEELNKLFAQYNKRLGRLYSDYVKKLASLGYGEDVLEGNALFHFDNFPELKARLDDIFANYFTDSVLCFKQGITDGVALAFSHDTDAISGFSVLSNKTISTLRSATATAFISSRLKTDKGLNLSQRIWNYCQQSKSEFEMAMSNVIADGIKDGTSAEDIARNIKQYLNDPDRMYRRYHTVKVLKNGKKKDVVTWRRRRVIDGKVRFIEEPLENVGTGVYRSSRMNALRVARTEINAAYLRGHNARWAKEPFVIGQWIHRSPQHKIEDICDELEGRYPKQFIFAGWHPSCMCTADPIMIEGEERKRFYDRLYAGEDMSNYVSSHNIDNIPDNYKQYILNNESKIISALKKDKLAWHLADNKKYWQKLCSEENQKLMGLETMSTKERIMQAAKKRHEQRTQEQIDHIQNRWNKHRRDYYNGLVDGVTGGKPVDSYKSKDLYKRYYAIREAIKDKKDANEIAKLFDRFKQGWQTKLAWTDRKVAMNVMKVAQNYGEIDVTGIASALKSADYALAKQEAKALAKSIKAIQNDEVSLSALIPDVNIWHKQFTSKQLHEVYDAVENKLAYINAKVLNTYKYKSLLEQQKALLENEIKYVANPSYLKPHNIYPTHQVAADAFKEQLNIVNYKIQIEDYLVKCKPIKTYIATHTNAKKLSELYSELISAISTKENQDILSVKFTNLEKRWQTVQKTNTTRGSKRSNDTHIVFEKACFTDKRKNAALQFHNANDAEAYYLDYAKEAYKNASDTFKSAAESYTRNSSSITRLLRGIDGWMEYDIWYVKENEPYINALTDVISKSRLKDDCWIVRDERAVFFTLKTGGLDVNILNKNIDSYSMKLKQKYIQKYGRLSEKIMNEIADKVDMYTEHEARQLVGREGFDPSFCSAGTSKNWEFCGTGGDNKFDEPKVHLEIYCPKGTQALYAAPYNHYNSKVKGADGFWDGVSPTRNISEAEIFLQRNTKYKVTSANYDSVKDKWYVKVEVIEQNPIEIDGYIDVLDPVNSKKGYKPKYK